MQDRRPGTKAYLIGSALLLSMFSLHNEATAASVSRNSGTPATYHGARQTHPVKSAPTTHATLRGRTVGGRTVSYAMAHGRHSYRTWGISCVPYARQVSGITVPGNAWEWWYNAAGQYARGAHPESGSVLVFRANGRMRLGHVAVVSQVVNAREVLIDHANWPGGGRGGVSHGVSVVDVSEANDWSAVRVQLPNRGEFGSVYPTYGFIYNRPDTGVMTASVSTPAPLPVMNPAPADLRPIAERDGWRTYEEVAQAPRATRAKHRHLDLRVNTSVRSR